MSHIVFISTKAPYFTSAYIDCLEAAMSAANADLDVSLILKGNASLQLLAGDSKAIGRKQLQKQLALLAIYGIEDIYVYQPLAMSIENQALASSSVKRLDDQQYRDLLAQADQVLVF